MRLVLEGTYQECVELLVKGVGEKGEYWLHDQIPASERAPGLFDTVESPHG